MIVFGLLKVATIYGDYVALQHAARDGSRKGSVTRGTGNADSTAVTNAVTTAVKASSSFLDPDRHGHHRHRPRQQRRAQRHVVGGTRSRRR